MLVHIAERSEGYLPYLNAASAHLEAVTLKTIARQLIDGGHTTIEELTMLIDALETGQIEVCPAPLISAWGWKAAQSVL